MALKFLYTLGFLFCLSIVASSNECTRHCAGTGAKVSVAQQTAPSQEEEADNPPNALIQLLYI
ncbi:MAG TPA: hypothetical protein VGM30_06500 [Puia sp.]|jgi:hypothetical protein